MRAWLVSLDHHQRNIFDEPMSKRPMISVAIMKFFLHISRYLLIQLETAFHSRPTGKLEEINDIKVSYFNRVLWYFCANKFSNTNIYLYISGDNLREYWSFWVFLEASIFMKNYFCTTKTYKKHDRWKKVFFTVYYNPMHLSYVLPWTLGLLY